MDLRTLPPPPWRGHRAGGKRVSLSNADCESETDDPRNLHYPAASGRVRCRVQPRGQAWCATYLEGAYAGVHGLEAEYDDIVSSAAILDPVDASQRQPLLTRIHGFLTQDNLRPELVRAAEGLKEARDSLRHNSEGFFKFLKPRRTEQRRERSCERS